jgi:hypothetical protein
MTARRLWIALAALIAAGAGQAQPLAPAPSALDGASFYELLQAELELRSGDPAAAFAKFVDVARRTRDEALFRRSVEVALQARSGDQALAATRAWRQTLPDSLEALRFELQILAVLNRGAETAEPIRLLLARTPAPELPGVIAGLPRLAQRSTDKAAMAQQLDEALRPYADAPGTRTAARVASARGWLQAGDAARALSLAQRAQADDASAPGPALLALEMMAADPAAERLVTSYLGQPDAGGAVAQPGGVAARTAPAARRRAVAAAFPAGRGPA